MRRPIPFLLLIFILVQNLIYAQSRYGDNVTGAHIDLSAVGSPFTFGLDYERAVTNPGETGRGVTCIGAILDYFSYSETFCYAGACTYTDFCISGVYHFLLSNCYTSKDKI